MNFCWLNHSFSCAFAFFLSLLWFWKSYFIAYFQPFAFLYRSFYPCLEALLNYSKANSSASYLSSPWFLSTCYSFWQIVQWSLRRLIQDDHIHPWAQRFPRGEFCFHDLFDSLFADNLMKLFAVHAFSGLSLQAIAQQIYGPCPRSGWQCHLQSSMTLFGIRVSISCTAIW